MIWGDVTSLAASIEGFHFWCVVARTRSCSTCHILPSYVICLRPSQRSSKLDRPLQSITDRQKNAVHIGSVAEPFGKFGKFLAVSEEVVGQNTTSYSEFRPNDFQKCLWARLVGVYEHEIEFVYHLRENLIHHQGGSLFDGLRQL